jgi:hypothetical protein
MMSDRLTMIWDTLLDYNFFTENELQLVTNINGLSEETLNDAIYSRYGYRSIEQLCETYNYEMQD